jgi:tRNA(Leu) C34 or U34 (ribose-2'-O)-methylase TrmL
MFKHRFSGTQKYQYTGNIGRLCVGTESRLHLVHPFGFVVNDKTLNWIMGSS